MKRLCMFTMLTLFLGLVFCEVKQITVLAVSDGPINGTTVLTEAIKKFKVDYPKTAVEIIMVDQTGGSTITIDSMLAAGEAPNIYFDSTVRVGKYMVPEYALDLATSIRDISKYGKNDLAPFTKNGKIYGLPMPGSAQGMFINLDIMKEIGYVVPNDWTIKDFLTMAELVRVKYNGKKYATAMFAANQSGDYLINNWFAAFGVPFYENGNYDKPVMSDKGGAKVYSFYQLLMTNGYIPKDSAVLSDDDMIIEWEKGNYAATGFFATWTGPYFESAITQGLIKQIPNYKFVPFPRAEGVKKVPTYINTTAIVIHKTGTEADVVSARFVELMNGPDIQGMSAKYGGSTPSRPDATFQPSDIHVKTIADIIATQGVMDVGLTDPRFPERRAIQFPILQKVLTFKMTPENAIKEYQKKMTEVK